MKHNIIVKLIFKTTGHRETVGKPIVLHLVDLGLISSTTYGFHSTASSVP